MIDASRRVWLGKPAELQRRVHLLPGSFMDAGRPWHIGMTPTVRRDVWVRSQDCGTRPGSVQVLLDTCDKAGRMRMMCLMRWHGLRK